MGTGWRRAFCTSVRRDSDMAVAEKSPDPTRSSRRCATLTFFSGGSRSSNPSTPRLGSLRCRTTSTPSESPKLKCKTATVESPRTPPLPTIQKRSPTLFRRLSSNPSSPRSRTTFSIFKATAHLSRIMCGICEQNVRSRGATAVFTAECSHVFHFPCIASHERTHGGCGGTISCPVCSTAWRQAPFLSSLGPLQGNEPQPPVLAGDRKPLHRPRMSREDKQCGSEAENRPVSAAAAVKKVYDDDEPLLLSTKPSQSGAGVRFNPIPEANEDDESGGNEDDELEAEGKEEFHDFSAKDNTNSNRSVSQSYKVTTGTTRAYAGGVHVTMMPEVALVSSGSRHQNYVVVLKVKAPAVAPLLSWRHRTPIDLVTVLDVSGGMTGAKIQMLKRAMRLVISSLGPTDRLSLVAFSAAATKRLLPLRRMSRSGQRCAWQIVERLVASTGGQGSCVGDALLKAAKVLEDRRERNPVATIMLLSDVQQQQDSKKDGQNNHRYPSAATAARTRFAHVEIPIHDTGFGDTPQHQLPSQSSSQALTVEDAFAKCVGGLVSVVMQDVLLQLFFPSGKVSAVYSCCGGRTVALGCSVRLGDLYAEEQRELLVELRVPTATGPDHHQHSLLVKCRYRDLATQAMICGCERSLFLPPLQRQSQRQGRPQLAGSVSSISLRLRNLFVTTRAVAESRRLADLSDYATALHLLFSARSRLLQALAASDQDQDLIRRLEAEISYLRQRREGQQQQPPSPCQRRREAPIPGGEQQLTPTSAWRAAERLAKVAIMRKSLYRVSDLHGFENARF